MLLNKFINKKKDFFIFIILIFKLLFFRIVKIYKILYLLGFVFMKLNKLWIIDLKLFTL